MLFLFDIRVIFLNQFKGDHIRRTIEINQIQIVTKYISELQKTWFLISFIMILIYNEFND